MVTIRAGLCAGRHELPVAEYVFEKPLDPTDFAAMREQAHLFVRERVGYRICRDYAPNQRGVWGDAETRGRFGLGRLVLYVTGLSAALAAVIDACVYYGVPLTRYDCPAGVGAGGKVRPARRGAANPQKAARGRGRGVRFGPAGY